MSPNQRLHTRQQSLSAVYDNISGSSKEVIVERAKQVGFCALFVRVYNVGKVGKSYIGMRLFQH